LSGTPFEIAHCDAIEIHIRPAGQEIVPAVCFTVPKYFQNVIAQKIQVVIFRAPFLLNKTD
jgi:hypothetical protein